MYSAISVRAAWIFLPLDSTCGHPRIICRWRAFILLPNLFRLKRKHLSLDLNMSSRGRWCGPVITRTSRRMLRRGRASLMVHCFSFGSQTKSHSFECHPERSSRFAKRNGCEVEGPLRCAFSPRSSRDFFPGTRRWENSLRRRGSGHLHWGPSTPREHPLRGCSGCAQDDRLKKVADSEYEKFLSRTRRTVAGQECPAYKGAA